MTSDGLLETEIGVLRKGWGLRRPNIRDRIGPQLRRLCDIDDTTTHSAARTRVRALLERAFAELPEGLALAARVMMGIEQEYGDRTLTQRQARLAGLWNVDPITVRRRCNLALQLASTYLLEHAGELDSAELDTDKLFRQNDWFTMEASTMLRLDTPTPEATEVRRIVALRDGLPGVALGMGLPRPRGELRSTHGLEVEPVFGGELEARRQPTAEYFVHFIRFPRPLAAGEQHTFSRVMRIPAGQAMAPRFVTRPLHRVDRFELRVKFHPQRPPRAVWRISGIVYPLAESDRPGRDLLQLDRLGETSVTFSRLRRGFGYGVQWLP